MERKDNGQKSGFICSIYGQAENVWIEEKDIPCVILKEFENFGRLGNHTEVCNRINAFLHYKSNPIV